MNNGVEFEEYFRSAGAIDLFCEIAPSGSRFTDLVEGLTVSKNTVLARIREGSELGLVSKEKREGSQQELWVPTERGMTIQSELEARNVPPRFREYRDIVRMFERERNAFASYFESEDTVSELLEKDSSPLYTSDEDHK